MTAANGWAVRDDLDIQLCLLGERDTTLRLYSMDLSAGASDAFDARFRRVFAPARLAASNDTTVLMSRITRLMRPSSGGSRNTVF